VAGFASKFFVHFVRVNDIVAMGTARRGLEVRRSIEMTDPKASEIIDNGGSVSKTKSSVELDAIGGPEFN
jgi:hypothetical protein